MVSVHDQIANKLARKYKAEYKSDKGIDIVLLNKVIEVETKKSGIQQGIKQIEKSNKARYLAVNRINVSNALTATKNTGIGVMNQMGHIVKKAGRSNG